MNLPSLYERLTARPELHARFVNTLSLLEYIGARKIVKSQHEKDYTFELLGHVSEEIRHAMTFKRVALELSGGRLSTYDEEHLLAGAEGRHYIQGIDHGVEKELGPNRPWLNYLYTTLLIEERAGEIYPAYQPFLEKLGHGSALKAIVREEEAHLSQILEHLKREDPENEARLQRIRALECQLFESWMEAVSQALAV